MAAGRILIVEDSQSIAGMYRAHLEREGFSVGHAASIGATRKLMGDAHHDLVLLDLGLPDGDGLALLREWREAAANVNVIVVTANASIGKAVEAVREGAADYLVKPVARERLIEAVNVVLRSPRRRAPRSDRRDLDGFFGLIGESEPMQRAYRTILAVAQSKAPVFITGETGTGKELCAAAIHGSGPRAKGPYVAINCAAIPRELMESEIFGHVKGSFTGAFADRDGAASLADGGTLFLDEVCELDPSLQTKLLRFLQTGAIQRVGSTVIERVDIRVVCATNRIPLEEVRKGRFREDLYYRLHVLPVHLPPLRDRGGDVLAIARSFLARFAAEEQKPFERFSEEAVAALLDHPWPGNVRELQNAVRQAVVLNEGSVVTREMLGLLPSEVPGRSAPAAEEAFVAQELWRIEKRAIETAIAACGGSVPQAAKILGVSPSTLYRKREAWAAMAA